jgi:hypothetical protein
MRSTHAQRLERWLGRDAVESMSAQMLGWHGPPLPVANVPGNIYVGGDGDFCGPIRGGHYANVLDYIGDRARSTARRFVQRQGRQCNVGFTSLGDLISEATAGGKRQSQWFYKGASNNTNTNQSLWAIGVYPPAGAAGAAIPGGAVPTNTTTGALWQTNAAGGDGLYITTVYAQPNANSASLILYDRLFHAGTILHTTTGAQAVTGVPTRYLTTASVGVAVWLEVTSALGTTAHNATITYTDQSGNAAEAAAAQAVTVSSAANVLPLPRWFLLLNSTDNGVRTVTNVAFSAVSSGQSQVVQGKPLVFIPQTTTGIMVVLDGINSAFNLVKVTDNACLAFLALQASATATTYQGEVVMVSG